MVRVILFAFVAAILWGQAPAKAFQAQFCSYNVLRLGTNRGAAKQAPKNTAIMGILTNNPGGNCDVIALHEVTGTKAKNGPTFADNLLNATPGAYTLFTDTGFGKGGYVEWPTIAVRNGSGKTGIFKQNTQIYFTLTQVWRPPMAVLVQDSADNNIRWFVAYHARWGKSVPQRRAEVADVVTLVNRLPQIVITGATTANAAPVIIGADWNLTAVQLAAVVGNPALMVSPPLGPTTVNTAGNLSSDYDTFVTSNTLISNFSVCDIACITASTGITSMLAYRKDVSDHLMVYGTVQ